MEQGNSSPIQRQKRNRHNRHKYRLASSSEQDTLYSMNNGSGSSPANSPSKNNSEQTNIIQIPVSKRVKCSDKEMKPDKHDGRNSHHAKTPPNVPHRIEIDAANTETISARQKLHKFAEMGFIKVELDDEQVQRNTVYQNSNTSNSSNNITHYRDTPTIQQQQYHHNTQPPPQQQQQQQQQHFVILEPRNVPPVQQQHAQPLHHQYTTVALQDREHAVSPPPNVPQRNSEVPILKKDFGPYHFTVELDEKEDTNKTPSWLMNTKNKLYTNINKAVPFHVKLRQWPSDDQNYQVRVTAVFSSHQYARAHVKRCPIHATTQHQTNIDFPFPEHVVRLDHPNAGYEKSTTGRLSVVVPLEQPQAGPLGDTMPLLLRFMCLCSCSGGINRRPLAIIFTLEKISTTLELYGRQTVDVRVCACPMRDYRNEEGNVPRQDRRCGRKRGGRTAHHNSVASAARLEILATDDSGVYDDIYNISVRGRKLFEFLMEMKQTYLRMHPEYGARYPDIDEDMRADLHMEEEQRLEEEAILGAADLALAEEYSNSQIPIARYANNNIISNAKHMNGRVLNSNNVEMDGGNLVVTYSNSQDIDMEQDYVDSGLNSNNSSQCLSRNSSFGTANVTMNNQQTVVLNSSSFQKQQQQQQQLIPQQQHIIVQQMPQQQQQVRETVSSINSSMTVSGNNTQVTQSNITNVANLVAHHQIIGSMKNAPKTIPASFVQNGAGNQPVILIYNASGMDDQLSQSINSRKILMPKPVMEGQLHPKIINANSNTVMSISGGGMSQGAAVEEDNNGSMRGGNEQKAMPDSTNVSLAIVKRGEMADSDDSNLKSSPKQQFRHLPISAVAQNPSRDQRKNICVAKKMPRLKPIPGKIISQNTTSGSISVSMSMGPQVILPSASGQVLLARNTSTSSHQILVPLSQSQSYEQIDVSSAYPNMSVVKREINDFELDDDDDDDDDNMNDDAGDNLSPGGGGLTTTTIVRRIDTRTLMNGSNNSDEGLCYDNSTTISSMNGQPDSAEMLAAQVLASNLGSRQ